MIRIVAALALFALAPAALAAEACAPAALHLLRHAEKASADDPDPVLSDVGAAAAATLPAWFDGKRVDAIYATHLRRTQQTALPLAAVRDLDLRVLPAGATAALVARLRQRHCGEHVVVVGHSNTVPEIAAAFVATPIVIGESDYGSIFTVVAGADAAERAHYGAAALAD